MEITIQEILVQLNQKFQPLSPTARLDAQVLVAHHLEKSRSWILAHPEAPLSQEQPEKIIQSVHYLENGAPLPYVIGHWEFYGLDFIIKPGVLIPRPETELLVERAITWLQLHPHKRRIVDVGTGSGCIGIAIARHIPDVQLMMTDISTPALDIARVNAEKHAIMDRVEFRQADLLKFTPRVSPFDLICANLPYIPSATLDKLPVANNEPRLALDGGSRGLTQIRRLVRQATELLTPGGLILLEIDPAQRRQVVQLGQKLFPSAMLRFYQDLSGSNRCLEIEQHYDIYHLCQRREWLMSQAAGEYRPDSLAIEGFIHCSQREQIIDVANRYYKNVPEMVLLTVNPEMLSSEIRWENSGGSYYPHIYGPINLLAVSGVTEMRPDDDGVYRSSYSPTD